MHVTWCLGRVPGPLTAEWEVMGVGEAVHCGGPHPGVALEQLLIWLVACTPMACTNQELLLLLGALPPPWTQKLFCGVRGDMWVQTLPVAACLFSELFVFTPSPL